MSKNKNVGLLDSLNNLPAIGNLHPMTRGQEALFIQELNAWRANHEILIISIIKQIQDEINEYEELIKVYGLDERAQGYINGLKFAKALLEKGDSE